MEEKTKAIEKVIKVLTAFGPDNKGIGTMELSRALGMNKSTVSRIVNTLVESGFLLRNPKKKYQLGWRIVSLGLAMTQYLNKNAISIVKPFIDELRDSIKETTTFSVLYGKDVILAYIALKPGPVSLSMQLGRRMPLHVAASAKAIFAFLSLELVEAELRKKLPKFTPKTITNPKTLKNQLKKIRKQGFAIDNGEMIPGVKVISVPVFNAMKEPIASVNVVGITSNIKWGGDSKIISKLKETSLKISEQHLGFNSQYNDEDAQEL